MVKYEIWEREIERHREEIERGVPFVTSIRDENLMWMKVKAVVAHGPLAGGVPAAILGDSSGIREKGEWSVRILETFSDDEIVITQEG